MSRDVPGGRDAAFEGPAHSQPPVDCECADDTPAGDRVLRRVVWIIRGLAGV